MHADKPGVLRAFLAGPGYLARGLGLWLTSPRVMFLGAIPALIVGTVFTAGFIVFAFNLETITVWLTPFAEDWEELWRLGIRITAGVAAIGVVILTGLFTFTAITLAVGDPFYERIWREVERREGNPPPDSEEGFWRSLRRGIGNGIRLLAATGSVALLLFACGFIPIVGQTVVPALGVAVGGWFLTVELTGFAFDSRGLRLRTRRRMLASRRASAIGFGVATYLLFLVPFGAVFVMPAAVAGATLLSRDVLPPGPAQEGADPHPG